MSGNDFIKTQYVPSPRSIRTRDAPVRTTAGGAAGKRRTIASLRLVNVRMRKMASPLLVTAMAMGQLDVTIFATRQTASRTTSGTNWNVV